MGSAVSLECCAGWEGGQCKCRAGNCTGSACGGQRGTCTTLALVFAGGAGDDEAPEEEVSAGDGTRHCGVRANKGFYWKEVGSVTAVLGWLFFVWGFFWWSAARHMEWWGGRKQDRESR